MARQRFSTYGHERPPLSRRTFRRLAAVLLLTVVVVIALVSSGVLSERATRILNMAVAEAASLGALLAWIWSAWRHPSRRRWRQCMTAAAASLLGANLLWASGRFIAEHRVGIELVAFGGYTAAVLFSMIAVIVHAFDHHEPRSPMRSASSVVMPALDLLIMLVSMALFVLVALGFPLQRTWDTALPYRVSIVGQPLAYLLLLATIVVLARFRREVRDLPIAFIALGALMYVIASTALAHTVGIKAVDVPAPLEACFIATPVFLGLAALAPTVREEVPEPRMRPTTREIALLAIPYLPLIASVALAVVGTLTHTKMPIEQAMTFLVLLLLVIVRQLATLAENLRLLRRSEHEALHDPLTGLANRALFMDMLELALRHRTASLVLVFCDMDDFKEINDSYGHVAGDEVLVRTARRLEDAVLSTDTVARLGGDEFAILLRDPQEPLRDLEGRLLAALQEPHSLQGQQRVVSASVGVTNLPLDVTVDNSDELLHLADTAMYTAKKRGKNTLTHLPGPREQPAR